MQSNYKHTKDVLRYSAVYKKRRKVKIVKMVFFGILALCILIGLILVLRMSTFTISEIQVKGLQSANTQDVINEVESEVKGNYVIFLPKKNIFFYPKADIRKVLLDKFSSFDDAEIKTIDTNKLEITIVEKNANAVSCKTERPIVENTFTECFFVDSNGKFFQRVVGEPDQSLPRYVDFNVDATSSILSADIMTQVKRVVDNLTSKNLITQYVKIIDSKNIEFKIKNNGKIIATIPISDDFISILNTALNTKMLSGSALFDYVDA